MVNNAVTPNTKIDVSLLRSCLVTAAGSPTFVPTGSFTIDLTTGTVTPTANGMDGEARATNGWIYVYAISTGSGAAGDPRAIAEADRAHAGWPFGRRRVAVSPIAD
jgi:hypothetical protein